MPDESILTSQEINDLLMNEPVGYLALARENNPYLVPLNFYFHEGKIYFHCRLTGRKVDFIRANPRACFHVSEIGAVIGSDNPCNHNYSFRSVLAEGTVFEIVESEAKEAVLRGITAKYARAGVAEAEIKPERIRGVAVYCFMPETISGKKDS